MGAELETIRRTFGPDDLKPLLQETGVDRTVLVQTISSFDETREFLDIAKTTDFIAGVVGWVDLTVPDVADTIASLESDLLVGIRHQVHDEPDARWLLRSEVQRGIAAVGEAGLVYDLLVRTRELPAALETVRRHPNTRFVIDHAAKPRIAAGPRDKPWEEALAPFADEANVFCKLSGLVTEADWIGPRLQPFGNVKVGSVIPTGFEAYARIETPNQLAGVLARHTSTPDRCWFCLWDGYGDLHGPPAVAYAYFWKEGEPRTPPPPGSQA